VPTLGDTSTQSTLARIAVRQVASDSAIRPIQDFAPLKPQGPEELARAVRRAETRDRVGELILEALSELPGAPLDAAAIFVVRPPLAIGWKGFCEDGHAVIESLAVPLDQPGLLADAYRAQRTTICSPTGATVIDERMWSLLGGLPPRHVLVAPIVVGDQCVCVLYVHSRVGLGIAEALCITLADAAATAFGRLLRAAQR
jgi:GAF domain-containing protein